MVPKETVRSIGGGFSLSLPHPHTHAHTPSYTLALYMAHSTPLAIPYKMTEFLEFVEGLEQQLSFGGKVNSPAETGQ